MAVVNTYHCDSCGDLIVHDDKKTELTTITVERPNDDPVVSHVHIECLNEAIDGNEFLESVVLHD